MKAYLFKYKYNRSMYVYEEESAIMIVALSKVTRAQTISLATCTKEKGH